jgi:hypothetical protein
MHVVVIQDADWRVRPGFCVRRCKEAIRKAGGQCAGQRLQSPSVLLERCSAVGRRSYTTQTAAYTPKARCQAAQARKACPRRGSTAQPMHHVKKRNCRDQPTPRDQVPGDHELAVERPPTAIKFSPTPTKTFSTIQWEPSVSFRSTGRKEKKKNQIFTCREMEWRLIGNRFLQLQDLSMLNTTRFNSDSSRFFFTPNKV